MSLRQRIEFAAEGDFVVAHLGEVRPENLELITHVHREIEEAVVAALRDAIDESLQQLQRFDENGSGRYVLPVYAVDRQNQFPLIGAIVHQPLDVEEHEDEGEGHVVRSTEAPEYRGTESNYARVLQHDVARIRIFLEGPIVNDSLH